MERKLHIGGTARAPGWEIFDAIQRPEVDHLGDAKDLSRFADGTFEAVYASHVLEHFDYAHALTQAVKEWLRVLAPGGALYVSVPDIDVLARLMLDKEHLDLSERWHVMRMMFGGHTTPHDYHLVGLNADFLVALLGEAGFIDPVRTQSFGLFDDTSEMVFKGVPISCNVVAYKPR